MRVVRPYVCAKHRAQSGNKVMPDFCIFMRNYGHRQALFFFESNVSSYSKCHFVVTGIFKVKDVQAMRKEVCVENAS